MNMTRITLDLKHYAEWLEAVEGIKKFAETNLPLPDDVERVGTMLGIPIAVWENAPSDEFWTVTSYGSVVSRLRKP